MAVLWLLFLTLCATSLAGGVRAATDRLPARISDDEFWRIVTSFSERAGTFPSDNLLSNETSLQQVIPELTGRVARGGVYLGVGPEQNFTYMVALRPRMAFIFDIRRGNLALHLIYKALFEMSADRVEFLSRLFTRKRPAGLSANASVGDMFQAIAKEETSEALYVENVRSVVTHLTKKHLFPLDAGDLLRLQHDYRAFHLYGPKIQYSSSRNDGHRESEPSYADLMVATDGLGEMRAYLASDESFRFMKTIEADNMVVPLVGNFSGPKAIRAVGEYLKENGAVVSVFYLSNVEEYLRQDGVWPAFCENVASLPIDATSTVIRSVRGRTPAGLFTLNSHLAPIAPMVKSCAD